MQLKNDRRYLEKYPLKVNKTYHNSYYSLCHGISWKRKKDKLKTLENQFIS